MLLGSAKVDNEAFHIGTQKTQITIGMELRDTLKKENSGCRV